MKYKDLEKCIKDYKPEKMKMTPLARCIKIGHRVVGNNICLNSKELGEYREGLESVSKTAIPLYGISYYKKSVQGVPAMWALKKESQGQSSQRQSRKRQLPGQLINTDERIILYCHGGGYTTGGINYASMFAGKMTMATGIRTVAHLYRLSPEYRYPAALEDTITVWDYLVDKGYKPEDIIVAGDSAGGNLALELGLYLKKNGRQLPGAFILLSPWTDMTMTAQAYERCVDADPILSPAYIETVRKGYLGDRTDYDNPEFSPLFGNLSGFPPTLIQVGSNEILNDDSVKLERVMKQSGVNVNLEEYRGCHHVFQNMPLISSFKAFASINKFVESVCN